MVEQIVVSFGSSAQKWLEAQRKDLEVYIPWKTALRSQRSVLKQLLIEWDKDHSGTISKKEFRRGVQAVGVRAPLHQINSLFDQIDEDEDGQVTPAELEKGLAGAGMRKKSVHLPPHAADTSAIRNTSAMQAYEEKLADNMNNEGNGDVAIGDVAIQDEATPQARALPTIEAKAQSNKVKPANPSTTLRTVSTTTAIKDNTTPPKASAFVTRPLERNATATLRNRYLHTAKADLDKNWVWEFKTFHLFPFLSRLRNLDHACRWLYPIVYLVFIFLSLSEIGFGTAHEQQLLSSECFRKATGV